MISLLIFGQVFSILYIYIYLTVHHLHTPNPFDPKSNGLFRQCFQTEVGSFTRGQKMSMSFSPLCTGTPYGTVRYGTLRYTPEGKNQGEATWKWHRPQGIGDGNDSIMFRFYVKLGKGIVGHRGRGRVVMILWEDVRLFFDGGFPRISHKNGCLVVRCKGNFGGGF